MTKWNSCQTIGCALGMFLLLGTGGRIAQADGERTRAASPFGIHGPQYSHWLAGKHPHPWLAGDARLTVLADIGAGWARQDFWWSLVEPEPGHFVWDDFDRAIASYERHGIELMVILCYGAKWMDGDSPQTDADRAAFAEYVYRMVDRYKGRVGAWEIWNEPNIQPYWSPRPDPALYTELLKVAHAAAKRADPDCIVLGGAMAGPDHVFLEGMYEAGAAGHFDVLSYHNYGQHNEIETEWPAVDELRAIMAAAGDGDKPIWHTESGFYTGPVGLSEAAQAARLVRYSVGLRALGIERMFQLTLNDWTDDPQHHDKSVYRGMTRSDYRQKPSYGAYRTMTQRLGDMRFAAAIRPEPGVSGYLFNRDRDTVLVLWRAAADDSAEIPLDIGRPLVLTQQMSGDWRLLKSGDGRYALPIGYDPMYVLDPGEPILRQRHVQWPNPVRTSLPRDKNVRLTATVTNPTDEPLTLHLRPLGTRLVGATSIPVPPGKTRELTMRLDASRLDVGPHELRWSLQARDAEKPFAQGYRLIEIEPPLELSFAPLQQLDPADPALPVAVRYFASKPTIGKLRLHVGGQPVGEAQEVTLVTGETATATLPVDLSAFASGESVPLEVVLNAVGLEVRTSARKPLIQCPPAPAGAKIDGDLGEWRERAPQIRPAMLSWEYVNMAAQPSADDLQVTGWLAYDRRGVWLALEVQDDHIALPQSRAIWNWDSLQVAFDLATDARPNEPFGDNDLEIELGGVGDEHWCYLGACPAGWPQAELTSKLRGIVRADEARGRVTYELLVPAELIVSAAELVPHTVMGFSLLVNDNDGAGRSGWVELTPGIGLGKRPAEFGWLWLQPE